MKEFCFGYFEVNHTREISRQLDREDGKSKESWCWCHEQKFEIP